MANRYWVGGTAAWDGTAGTKWAANSGGPGGETVPTTADDVFFDNGSGTSIVTISIGNTGAKSINCTGFTGELAGTTNITVAGSVTYASTMSDLSYKGTMTISGTGTFTSAGRTIIHGLTVNGTGITVSLGDAFNGSGASAVLTVTAGTFNASNYNVTIWQMSSGSTSTRSIVMGSGTWTLSGTGTIWNTGNATQSASLTLTANTANILLSNTSITSRTFTSNGKSYNKITIGGTTGSSSLLLNLGTDVNSVPSSLRELASIKTVAHTILFGTTALTVDSWTVKGSSGNVCTVNSSSTGNQRTITLTYMTLNNVNFLSVRDINIVHPNRFYVGKNSTNTANNTNVIFNASPSGNFASFFY